MRCVLLTALVFLLARAGWGANPPEPHLRGTIEIHDPSTIVKHGDHYYVFGTGRNIISRSSPDRVYWTNGPRVFQSPPAWTVRSVPGFQDTFWAPDIVRVNGKYHLYYSVSTWGSQVSAIGLVTNPTLDPKDPAYAWTDQGPVIESRVGSPYNTIDPSLILDGKGDLWMAFGSYWNGIYLVQLDPGTGKRISTNSPVTRLAFNSSIEAAGIKQRGNYFYLFVNWGSCCVGVNSTYHMRIGRSTSITGPYLDRNGVNLANNGGSVFLEGTGKYAGPGHAAFFTEDGRDWMSYHYYDAGSWSIGYRNYGTARFDIVPLTWSSDGWPAYTNDWRAEYLFERDATDTGGQYSGLLQGTATVTNDAALGGVLELQGTNAYAHLPPSVAFARTFTALVKWNGGAPWQRIFDFGTGTSNYVMLTPSSGSGKLQCDIKAGGSVQSIVGPSPLPIGVWTHVGVTFDGRRGVLYMGGQPVATNLNITLSPLDVRAQTNHLGKSKFVADANFSGQIASFRAFGRVLSPQEVAGPLPSIFASSAQLTFSPGQQISVAGGATDFAEKPLGPERLIWTVDYLSNGVPTLIAGPVSGSTNVSFDVPSSGTQATSGVYRVSLKAVDAVGRTSTRSHYLFPALAPPDPGTNTASFYPFERDASDLTGPFDGTLVAGAITRDDATRGRVLQLFGNGPYVTLPAPAGEAQTISAWVRWNGGSAWQRIFDFGQDTERFFFLTPRTGGGRLQCAITAEASSYVHTVEGPSLSIARWTHLAVSLNGLEAILYVDGRAVGINNAVNILPSDVAPTRSWLGRSQFSADPFFSGLLDSVKLDFRPLTGQELFASGFPEAGLRLRPVGQGLLMEWQEWLGTPSVEWSTNLTVPPTWSALDSPITTESGHRQVFLPAATQSAFFRVLW